MKLSPHEQAIANEIRDLRRSLAEYQKSASPTRADRFIDLYLNPLVSDVADMKLGYTLEPPSTPNAEVGHDETA